MRALILSCSKAKVDTPGEIPAIERYTGPAVQVIRKYLATDPADPPRIYFLGGRMGLIDKSTPIPDYDVLPYYDPAKSPMIGEQIAAQIDGWDEVALSLSQAHMCFILDNKHLFDGTQTTILRNGIYFKTGDLYKWLYGKSAKWRPRR